MSDFEFRVNLNWKGRDLDDGVEADALVDEGEVVLDRLRDENLRSGDGQIIHRTYHPRTYHPPTDVSSTEGEVFLDRLWDANP